MEEENIITNYIAVWGWMILSIIFLVGSLIIVSSSENILSTIFFIVFLISFAFCQVRSYAIRKNIYVEDAVEFEE